jgi:hypothetical protein
VRDKRTRRGVGKYILEETLRTWFGELGGELEGELSVVEK